MLQCSLLTSSSFPTNITNGRNLCLVELVNVKA